VTLFIVEDNLLLQKNLELLLNGEPEMEVLGTASSAEAALDALRECQPDILITDLGLPEMPGVALIQAVKARFPQVQIIANTIYEDNDTVFQAIRAGASGYLLKGSTPRILIEAIRELYEGGAPMSPRIAKKVIMEMQECAPEEQYLLTPREQEVLRLIEKGFSYAETGEALFISTHTVNAHIKRIYQKLHAKNRTEALTIARQKGIL